MPQKVFHGHFPVVLVTLYQVIEERVVKNSARTEDGVLDAEGIHVLKDHNACSGKEL